MTKTKFITIPTDQPDDYQDVVEPKAWTLDNLVNLKNRTASRFTYRLLEGGKVAEIRYRNYTLGYNDSKIKINSDSGGAILKPIVQKQVVIV